MANRTGDDESPYTPDSALPLLHTEKSFPFPPTRAERLRRRRALVRRIVIIALALPVASILVLGAAHAAGVPLPLPRPAMGTATPPPDQSPSPDYSHRHPETVQDEVLPPRPPLADSAHKAPANSASLPLPGAAGISHPKANYSSHAPPPASDPREHGRWVRRDPPLTPGDMAERWGAWWEETEWLPAGGPELDEEASLMARRQRALTLANWVWDPAAPVVDPMALTTRLLAAPGGLLIVGDSINLQLFHHIRMILPRELDAELDESNAPVYGFRNAPGEGGQPGHLRVTLPDTLTARDLLRRAGAPTSRLARPILTFLRDDLLLPLAKITALRDEVVKSTADDGGWAGFLGRLDHPYKAGEDGSDGIQNVVFGDWRGVHAALVAKPWAGGAARDTILLLNSGAHWSPVVFTGIGAGVMKTMYERMVELVVPELAALPRTTVLVRPTIPGHRDCESFSVPAEKPEEQRLQFWEDMGWGLFAGFNDVWREKVPATAWLPVWERSLMRPDAHRLAGDCLHIEGPGVFDEWLDEMWRAVSAFDAMREVE